MVSGLIENLTYLNSFLNNPILYIIPAILIVITLVLAIYHSILRKNLYYNIYPELKRKLMIEEITF